MISHEKLEMFTAVDLDPIKIKLMHESGEGWSAEHAAAVETEYRRFLYLAKVFPQEHLATTEDVDIFWHYHILDTMKYAADCELLFGYFLHHFPYAGMRGEDDRQALDCLGERTAMLYQQTFGAAPSTPAERNDSSCQVVEQAGLRLEIRLEALGNTAQAAWCLTEGQPARPTAKAAWCLTDGQAARPTAKAAWCLTDGQGARYTAKAAWCLTDGQASRPTARAAWCLTDGQASRPTGKAAWCLTDVQAAQPTPKFAWCLTDGPVARPTAKAAWCLTDGQATRPSAQATFCCVSPQTAGTSTGEISHHGKSERIAILLNSTGFYTSRPTLSA
jgi:hypothetical protein